MSKENEEREEHKVAIEKDLVPLIRNLELYGEIYPGAIEAGIEVARREWERKRKL
jgi:hypothetical protein